MCTDLTGCLLVSYPVHFLLGATFNLDHHFESYENSVAENIRDNIYADNVITGKDTVKEAVDFYVEANQIFRKASK